jgi:hypothetical protein
MKIAICVCDVDKNSITRYLPDYLVFLQELNHEVDYFVHGWDDTLDEITQISSSLNISSTNYLIEPVTKRANIVETSKLPKLISSKSTVLYSLMRSAHLKTNYELQNHILYDMCIGICGDINYATYHNIMRKKFISPNINTIYTFDAIYSTHTTDRQVPYFTIPHEFFYSDTLTFNKIAEFYRFFPELNKIAIYELPLAFYIKMLNIENKNQIGVEL